VLRFFFWSLAIVLGLYAVGYYPASTWDAPSGPFGLLSGLTVALLLMAASFIVMRWALFRSQRIFMTAFGVGFIVRLVVFVAIFFVYVKFVGEGVASFAVSFAACYLGLGVVEFLCLRSRTIAKRE